MKRLNKKFFEQNTLQVARELLGKTLVRKWRGREIRGIIIETEAYMGFKDEASHASRGVTPRNKIMFGGAGTAYVYLIYGMHNCLNIVTENKDYPAAVLIRGVVVNLSDVRHPTKDLNGPGKLTKFFHIDRALNEEDITKSKKLWIEMVQNISKFKYPSSGTDKSLALKIKKGQRIGIDYAGAWRDKKWRFYLEV